MPSAPAETSLESSYLTTPIYYVNAAPHLGHAHTSVMGDILRRARRMAGMRVLFSTGTDEHGQKNAASARKSGLGDQAYLDERSGAFRALFDRLDVGYDIFVRTSAPAHKALVAKLAGELFTRGRLVKRSYAGLYCQGCEQFKRATDLTTGGLCADHPTLNLEALEEENYFLPIDLYRARLLAHLDARPDWVAPASHANAVRALLAEPLEDLCISRPRTRVGLGVTLPFDADYVAYVWFDALINYLSNLGWPAPDAGAWWAGAEHLIGKDILKTHAVHWPCMLMALDLPLPQRISVHAHWLGPGGRKMSKTAGNVVEPFALVDRYGADAVRFYLARSMRAGDGQVSEALVGQAHVELGNKLGNLVLRLTGFCERRLAGTVPDVALEAEDASLVESVCEAVIRAHAALQDLASAHEGVDGLVAACERLNDHLTRRAPWTLARTVEGTPQAESVVAASLDALRLVLEGFHPVMPRLCERALRDLGQTPPAEGEAFVFAAGRFRCDGPLKSAAPLFPRVETPVEAV